MNSKTYKSDNYNKLYDDIFKLYHLPENKSKLLFHGWHHIKFVHDKALEFSEELEANSELVSCSGLLHDLNYIFSDKLEPEEAKTQIIQYMIESGYDKKTSETVAKNIEDSHLSYRGSRDISNESKALADADTLFKALPTTPILFASKFITQNKYDIYKLANKVVGEQKPLLDNDKYFYTDLAKEKYLKWAKINLSLWENVLESLEDISIKEMLKNAYELEVL